MFIFLMFGNVARHKRALHLFLYPIPFLNFLAIFYNEIMKAANTEVIQFIVYGRLFAAVGIILMALLDFSKMTLILFARVDIATAIWTLFEAKKA